MLKEILNKKLFYFLFVLLLVFLSLLMYCDILINIKNIFLYHPANTICILLNDAVIIYSNYNWIIRVLILFVKLGHFPYILLLHLLLFLPFLVTRRCLEFEITNALLIRYGLFFFVDFSNIIVLMLLILLFYVGICMPHHTNILLVAFLFIWVRAAFPRYRYDQLMHIGWKQFLPLMLGFFSLIVGLVLGMWY